MTLPFVTEITSYTEQVSYPFSFVVSLVPYYLTIRSKSVVGFGLAILGRFFRGFEGIGEVKLEIGSDS